MKHTQLKKVIDSIIDIADAKKAEDLRAYFVAEKNWMTESVVVIGVLNRIQSKSILEDIENFASSLDNRDDFFDFPRISGTSESGWVIIDLNSIVIHCVDQQSRSFYEIDSLLELQGEVYHY